MEAAVSESDIVKAAGSDIAKAAESLQSAMLGSFSKDRPVGRSVDGWSVGRRLPRKIQPKPFLD